MVILLTHIRTHYRCQYEAKSAIFDRKGAPATRVHSNLLQRCSTTLSTNLYSFVAIHDARLDFTLFITKGKFLWEKVD